MKGRTIEHSLFYFVVETKKNNGIKFYLTSFLTSSSAFYFIKLYREHPSLYNDKQDRTIWDYDLNLTEEQVLNFVYHIWELKGIEVPYNFINHNCGTGVIYMLASIDTRFFNFIKKTLYDTIRFC
jgi:hypothetical protein